MVVESPEINIININRTGCEQPWDRSGLRVDTRQQFDSFSNLYTLGKELGRGEYGITHECVENATGNLYACKSIRKGPLMSDLDRVAVHMEIEILQKLVGYPNIVHYKGAHEDDDSVHILMDLCTGGSLADQIAIKGRHSECEAAGVFLGLVTAVRACHDAGIIHRDIKPGNALFSSCDGELHVKLIDFGLSVLDEDGDVHTDMVGSPLFIAPEILLGCYGKEVDIWSLGVILYILFSGSPPLAAGTKKQLFQAILCGRIDLDGESWSSISSSAKDLLLKMLKVDPRKRITAAQILDHPWIRNVSRNQCINAPTSAKKLEKVNRFYIKSGGSNKMGSCDLTYLLNSL